MFVNSADSDWHVGEFDIGRSVTPVFWTHALATAAFAGVILWRLQSGAREDQQRRLLAALAMTAVWAWLTAIQPGSMAAGLAETARNLLWVAVLHGLSLPISGEQRQHGVRLVYTAVAATLGLQFIADALPLAMPQDSTMAALIVTRTILRITAAAGGLVLVHNLYGQAAPTSRGPIRSAMIGLSLLWIYDLNSYTLAYLDPRSAEGLFAWRGLAVMVTAPLFALAVRRDQNFRIRLSRAATFQSLSLLAICGYFAVMTILATALKGSGRDWVELLSIGAIALTTVAALVLLPSSRARSWVKVKLAKHLFEHRYDYRTEWLRFTGTIGRSGPDAPPLGERVISAFADILDAPGGLLLIADESGAIDPAAAWNWPGEPIVAGDPRPAADFWRAIESEGRVLDLDVARRRWGAPRDPAVAIPAWLLDDETAWVGVPLIHHERLVGLVLLAAPDYRRALDWEDFDLLRTAGRQAASSLAEAHGQEALTNAQRFEEFNRRFAFILHDVKNLVSQLSLLSRNAERHADNPEFRADMVATLKGSVGKMNDLLARLAPQAGQRSERAEPTPLRDLLSAAIAAKRRDHDVRLLGQSAVWAMVDPLGLEQAVGHLLQNAIDASPGGEPVTVRVSSEQGEIAIAIIDQGIGMDSEFVRHRLFQPFASTKQGGFGVGAFEARSLVASMGGRLSVTSAPGKGSSFTIYLVAAEPAPLRKIA